MGRVFTWAEDDTREAGSAAQRKGTEMLLSFNAPHFIAVIQFGLLHGIDGAGERWVCSSSEVAGPRRIWDRASYFQQWLLNPWGALDLSLPQAR